MINTKNPSVEFTALDQCDRCPQRAIALASYEGLELLFCRHHIRQHNLALEMSGWQMSFDYDELARIAPNEKVPV